MKYFEFNDSDYYALIGAKSKEQAIKYYQETVADFDEKDEITEITKEEAKQKLIKAACGADIEIVEKQFDEASKLKNPYLILVDGSLL